MAVCQCHVINSQCIRVLFNSGILVDSSRHYLPLYTLQQMIDAMAAVKFNVMHWHLVDAIAIPIKSDKFPELVKASYATDAAYNMQEVLS